MRSTGSLNNGVDLKVKPASALTPDLRSLILDNKPELVELLADAHDTTQALMEAINRCCAVRGDDDANRQGLIDECSRLAPHEQADLREHFEQEAVRWVFPSPRCR